MSACDISIKTINGYLIVFGAAAGTVIGLLFAVLAVLCILADRQGS